MRRTWATFGIALGISLVASSASAVTVFEDKETGRSLNVGVLMQAQMQLAKDAAPDTTSSLDFFARRMRLIASGSVTKQLTFFLDFDQPNYGKNGDWSAAPFLQDAFFSYEFARELTLDAGMILVPASRHGIEGAVGLHALDYHTSLIKPPPAPGILAQKSWRDAGIQLRGLALGDRLHYRLGVFEGARGPGYAGTASPTTPPAADRPQLPLNPGGTPRFTGMLRYNILGVEEKFFFSGIYFSETPIVSVGLSFDYQYHAVRTATAVSNYQAQSLDVFAEYPLDKDNEIIGKVAGYRYRMGDGSASTGLGMFGEAGYRHKWFEPVIGCDIFHAEKGQYDLTSVRGGFNFWITKHAFNVKSELSYSVQQRPGANDTKLTTKDLVGTVQGQVFF